MHGNVYCGHRGLPPPIVLFASCTVELRLPPKQTADSQPVSLAQLQPVGFVCCECPCHRCPRLLVLPPRKPSRIPRHHALSLHTCTHGTVPVTISVSRKGQGKSGGLSPAQHSPRAPPLPHHPPCCLPHAPPLTHTMPTPCTHMRLRPPTHTHSSSITSPPTTSPTKHWHPWVPWSELWGRIQGPEVTLGVLL